MKARGKRKAKRSASPLDYIIRIPCSPERGVIPVIFRPFRPYFFALIATRGDALHFASHLPLAFIFRAFGALFRRLCKAPTPPPPGAQ
jgi:hypothetical protein